MIPKIWRLSENSGDDNLGLACTEKAWCWAARR